MCVIIYQPRGSYLEKDRAKRLWECNPDGGGFAFFDDIGDLQISKYLTFGQFWKDFEQARSQFPKRQFLAHMRIATHGLISLDNVHPFQLSEHQALAHNGVFNKVPDDPTDEMSDTRMFMATILPSFKQNWLDNPTAVEMVEDYMGWSRMAIINNNSRLDSEIYLFNEMAGTHKDGMWFSSHQGVTPHQAVVYPGKVGKFGGNSYNHANDNKSTDKINWDELWAEDDRSAAAKVINWPTAESTALRATRFERYGKSQMYFSKLQDEWVCTRCQTQIMVPLGVCDCEVIVHAKNHCWKILSSCKHTSIRMAETIPIEKLSEEQWDKVAAMLP